MVNMEIEKSLKLKGSIQVSKTISMNFGSFVKNKQSKESWGALYTWLQNNINDYIVLML